MRKKTVNNIFDQFMWHFLYMLPFVLLLISIIAYGMSKDGASFNFTEFYNGLPAVFDSFFTNTLDMSGNVVYTTLSDLFGSASEVFPFFKSAFFPNYFTYFIMLSIIHVVVDVLLFLPRICHNLLERASK